MTESNETPKGMMMNDAATDRLLRDVFSARPETHLDRLRAGYVREYPLELTQADRERVAAQMNRYKQTVCEIVTRNGGVA